MGSRSNPLSITYFDVSTEDAGERATSGCWLQDGTHGLVAHTGEATIATSVSPLEFRPIKSNFSIVQWSFGGEI